MLSTNMGPTASDREPLRLLPGPPIRTHLVERPGQDHRQGSPPQAQVYLPEDVLLLREAVTHLEARVGALEAAQLSTRLRRAWAWVVAQYHYAASFWSSRP